MPATDLEKLLVSVQADLKQYEKEWARARQIGVKALRDVEKGTETALGRVERSWKRLGGVAKAGIAGFASGLSVQILARAAQQTIKAIADIGDAADKLGLTTDAYQELAFAAKLAGVETDAFATAMKKLAVNSSDAANGQGELGEIFKLNKVSIKDANGNLLDQTQILARVADLVKNARSEQDKAAIAVAAFGKAGVDMLNLLNGGAEAVVKAMLAARDASIKFTELQIRKAQEFDDKLDTLIQKISVGLKGSFIDAAIGVEAFAARAGAALDSIGIKSEAVSQSLLRASLNALKYNPLAASTTLALDALIKEGQSTGIIPLDPSLRGRAQRTTLSGGGKGDMGTIMPNPQEERDLAQAKRDQAKADREAARAEKERADAAQDRFDKIRETMNENAKASISIQEELNDQRLEQMQAMEDSLRSLAELGLNAFERIAFGGEKLKDVLNDVVKQLASAALQAAILGQGPLAGLFGGGGGLFGGLFSGGIASLYHSGGIVGMGGGKRAVNPLAFAGAQRFHGGGMPGLRSGEVAAILQKGETVLPRGKRAGGFSLSFAPVIDNRGADAAAVARLERSMAEMARNFERNVRQIVTGEKARNPRFLQ